MNKGVADVLIPLLNFLTLKYVFLSQILLGVTFFKVAESDESVFGCIGNNFEHLKAILRVNFCKTTALLVFHNPCNIVAKV